jgi:hypothetical protein
MMNGKFVWIYVDGERKLILLESIYIPRFEKEEIKMPLGRLRGAANQATRQSITPEIKKDIIKL